MKPRRKTTGSIVLEKKPPGWIIQAAETEEGLLLHWPLYASILNRLGILFARIFLPVWLCGWIVGGVTVGSRALAGNTSGGVFVWLIFWTLALFWTSFLLIALYKPSRPEAIVFADDWFCYDPGASCPAMYGAQYSFVKHWRYVFAAPRRAVLPRSDLAKFELVRTGDRQRLSFQHDLETVEIGNCLVESERKWLFTVLEHWRSGIDLFELQEDTVQHDRGATVDAGAIRADSTDIRR